MKTFLALVACSLAAVALAPVADASSIDPIFPKCVSMPENQSLCVDPRDPQCQVWQQPTVSGGQHTCLYPTSACDPCGPPPAAASAGPSVDCYQVYSRTNVGHYSIVRRNSCAVPEVYDCPYEGAPIDRCQNILGVRSASAEIPWPGGQTPDVQCMDVYSATQVPGTGYWIVRRDSCSVQVFWCPEGSQPPAPPCQEGLFTAAAAAALPGIAAPPIYCMPYERRIEAGPLTVIQGGCGNDIRLCDDGDGGSSLLAIRDAGDVKQLDTDCLDDLVSNIQCSDIYARHEVGPVAVVMTSGCSGHVEVCDDALPRVDLSCAVATTSASEPMCMYYYRETTVGPVRHVQRDSCHSETYVCDEDANAYVAGQLAKPDANGFVQCTWESTGLVGPVIW